MDKIVDIPIEKIFKADHAVRAEITAEDVNGLTSSIARLGMISPLVVEKDGDKYKIVSGHRRCRAAELANLKAIPCIVKKITVLSGRSSQKQYSHSGMFRHSSQITKMTRKFLSTRALRQPRRLSFPLISTRASVF